MTLLFESLLGLPGADFIEPFGNDIVRENVFECLSPPTERVSLTADDHRWRISDSKALLSVR
jgi:hypothetical protein